MKPSVYWLPAFIPITVILEHAGITPPVIFFSAALAIVPIAVLLVRCGADRRRLGADVLNATFDNRRS